MFVSPRVLGLVLLSASLCVFGCPGEHDDDTADDDACDDDSADDDACDDDATDDDATAGDDDSAGDPMAPYLYEMDIQHAIEGFGECVIWVIWQVEDPDGDLDGCTIHLTIGELYVAGSWTNPDATGPYHALELRMRVPVGEEGDGSLDYKTEYDVDLWMQDAAGHASNHLFELDWESPDEELCNSLDLTPVSP